MVNSKLNWRIFIFCVLGTNGLTIYKYTYSSRKRRRPISQETAFRKLKLVGFYILHLSLSYCHALSFSLSFLHLQLVETFRVLLIAPLLNNSWRARSRHNADTCRQTLTRSAQKRALILASHRMGDSKWRLEAPPHGAWEWRWGMGRGGPGCGPVYMGVENGF